MIRYHFYYTMPFYINVFIIGPILLLLLYRSYVTEEWKKFAHTSYKKFHWGNLTVSIAAIVSLVHFVVYTIYMQEQQVDCTLDDYEYGSCASTATKYWGGRRKRPPKDQWDEAEEISSLPLVLLLPLYWLLLLVATYNNNDNSLGEKYTT